MLGRAGILAKEHAKKCQSAGTARLRCSTDGAESRVAEWASALFRGRYLLVMFTSGNHRNRHNYRSRRITEAAETNCTKMEPEKDYDLKGEQDGQVHQRDLEPSATGNDEFNLAHGHNQLERGLKSRHIQFLALGTGCLSSLYICAVCSNNGQD